MSSYFKINKIQYKIFVIFVSLFSSGIILTFLGLGLSKHDNNAYQEIQQEIQTCETIKEVYYNKDTNLLYVCYDIGSYVNVYDTDGKFQWAVSTPYETNGETYFTIHDNMLMISHYDTYIYNAQNGTFIDRIEGKELDELVSDAETSEYDTYSYSLLDVYKIGSDGGTTVLVSRPIWLLLVYPPIDFLISLFGATGIGVLILISAISERKKGASETKSKKAKRLKRYFQVTSCIQIAFAVTDIIAAAFGIYIMIGIMVLGIHFIISNIIIWNVIERGFDSEDDTKIIDMWKVIEIASFIIAFFSVIVATAIAE